MTFLEALGLVTLAVAVLAVAGLSALWSTVQDLRRRLENLDAEVRKRPVAELSGVAGPAEPETGETPGAAPPRLPEAAPEPEGAPPARPVPPAAPGWVAGLSGFLSRNWVYLVAAASLALAGLFLVQYGVEQGLVTPALRVLLAVLLGLALAGAGLWVRARASRAGDGSETGASGLLAQVLAAAGLVSLYGAGLGAFALYGLIGPLPALGALILVSLASLLLALWLGPLLAAIGLVGGTLAPFVVGEGGSATGVFVYLTATALTGLAIDAVARWRWVSWLALVLPSAAGGWLAVLAGDRAGLAVQLTVTALGALAIHRRRLLPDHVGAGLLDLVARRRPPDWTVWLAWGAALPAATVAAVLPESGDGGRALSLVLLAVLSLGLSLWAHRAPALTDLGAVPTLGLWGFVLLHLRGADPKDLYAALAAGAALSLGAGLRAFWTSGGVPGVLWALIAVLSAPQGVHVVRGRVADRVTGTGRGDLQAHAPPPQAVLEHGDVPPIRVDVHLVGVEMAQPDDGAHRSAQ